MAPPDLAGAPRQPRLGPGGPVPVSRRAFPGTVLWRREVPARGESPGGGKLPRSRGPGPGKECSR